MATMHIVLIYTLNSKRESLSVEKCRDEGVYQVSYGSYNACHACYLTSTIEHTTIITLIKTTLNS